MYDYSKSEQKLIAHFGFINLMDNLSTPPMYRLMVEEAFMKNDQSEYADALRAANHAFTHRTVHRCTEEFDSIIEELLYTDEMRIKDREAKLIDYWNSKIPFIKESIELEKEANKDSEKQDDYAFKWTQLVHQEIFMYNSLNKQVEYEDIEFICERRRFNQHQRQFIIDALDIVGLAENLKNIAICDDKIEEDT